MALRTVAAWSVCAGLLAGCGGPSRPAAHPSASASWSSGLRPERLRSALVDRVGRATLDRARKATITVGEPLAWGAYGSLDHAMTASIPVTPRECGQALHAVGPAKDPAAPAAAVSLRQDDGRAGGELLVATSPANIAAELRYRVPAACRRIRVGGVSEVAQDLPVAWPGGQARGMTVREEAARDRPPATACSVFFPTGHGRLLGEAYFSAPTEAEACRTALALAHAADLKARKLI